MQSEINYEKVNVIIYMIELIYMQICCLYTSQIITNLKKNKKIIDILLLFIITVISIICSYIKFESNFLNSTMFLILQLAMTFSIIKKRNFSYSICIITISLTINYIIFSISIFINFFVNKLIYIQNDYINFLILICINTVLLILLSKIKRIKNGLIFLYEKLENGYFIALILNISVVILFTIIILPNYKITETRTLGIGFILISITMFITIKQSFQTYYKQKLLIKELEETKKELQEKKEEIEKLEKENLEISKTSHSISHKQKSLEHKINEILKKQETAEELDIKDRINNISKQLSEKQTIIELTKTNIQEIDDMLNYMQSECTKNKIDFQLQTNGNILSMTNNIISKEELEILLADHIKDAIIAIKYSDNSYKNILVRLGKIDGVYSIYIYDTGIEFETNTLKNLGKKPITTHKNDGGTGMGFINTFETLKKHKASLIIKEIGKPSKDDYTKIIIIKFDNKNNFIIDTYR